VIAAPVIVNATYTTFVAADNMNHFSEDFSFGKTKKNCFSSFFFEKQKNSYSILCYTTFEIYIQQFIGPLGLALGAHSVRGAINYH